MRNEPVKNSGINMDTNHCRQSITEFEFITELGSLAAMQAFLSYSALNSENKSRSIAFGITFFGIKKQWKMDNQFLLG